MQTEIPSDWSTAPLRELAKRVRRTADGTSDTIAMITSTEGFVPQSDKYSRFMAGESLQNYVALRRGEFAYNKGNSKTYPQGCIYRQDEWDEAAVPSVYISFRLTDGRLDSDFAAQFFAAGGLNYQLKRVITSGARANGLLNVSKDDFFACDIPLPPLPEQKKIAAILASVDQSIQATEAVIEQTRRVKEGLLQDLLTRGIGHTRFKQTEIGEIPESWRLSTVGDLVSSIVAGRSPSASDEPASGSRWGVLKVSAVGHGTFFPSENKSLPDGYDVRDEHTVRSGDVLITRANTAALVGACCRVPEGGYRLMLCDKTLRLEPDHQLADPGFLFEAVGSPRARQYFARAATGSSASMKNLSQVKIKALPIATPPLSEQRHIVSILSASNEEISASQQAVDALIKVKAGLLEDLLTGAVRVSP